MTDEQIKRDYEEETGVQIIERFKNLSYEEVQMVLVACHAPFTWGQSPQQAVYNAVILEELAKMALFTLMIDPNTPDLKKTLLKKHYYRKHGENAYYGQNTKNKRKTKNRDSTYKPKD
jgi:L-ribulose-5-phosphate 4-epimerase